MRYTFFEGTFAIGGWVQRVVGCVCFKSCGLKLSVDNWGMNKAWGVSKKNMRESKCIDRWNRETFEERRYRLMTATIPDRFSWTARIWVRISEIGCSERRKKGFIGWGDCLIHHVQTSKECRSGFSSFILPSWELTYPPKMAFWRWYSFSQGGIC